MVQIGIKNSKEVTVGETNTAKAMGSGTLEVFATPAVAALMEAAAAESVEKLLAQGQTSVGTMLSIRHTAATPVGMTVRAESELITADERRLVFSVKAYDAAGAVAEGTHERFIVDAKRFIDKTNLKK